MASDKVVKLIEEVKALTVLELSELVRLLKRIRSICRSSCGSSSSTGGRRRSSTGD